ncbi:MAG: hypothetical protein MZV64_16795 [Ignavibacteriales bacterium]|nr:hypothetical protein [Ignavibacteriales bacterium]
MIPGDAGPSSRRLHPFAPSEQAAAATTRSSADLETWLAEITGLRGHRCSAELRRAGRVRRPAGHPGLPPRPRRGAPQRLPHPRLGARHQPRERRHGGHGPWSSVRATSEGTSTSPTCAPKAEAHRGRTRPR